MTKRQRSQVVELLRCAADERADGIGLNGMWDAERELGIAKPTADRAWDALHSTPPSTLHRVVVGRVDEDYRADLLEAAARVEEGSWP